VDPEWNPQSSVGEALRSWSRHSVLEPRDLLHVKRRLALTQSVLSSRILYFLSLRKPRKEALQLPSQVPSFSPTDGGEARLI
jgi:hypothetical protein